MYGTRRWLLATAACFVLVASAWLPGLPHSAPAEAQGPAPWPQIRLLVAAAGLNQPVHIAHAGDDTGRLFVVERPGRILILRAGPDAVFLDITGRVLSTGGEQGLLSVAFPPGYAVSGRFYVAYTRQTDGALVLARFYVTADPDAADPNSEQPVLVIPHPQFANHNGGQLAFGPLDGYLYAGTGDGGGTGDPDENAQDPGALLGKLLRLDVETGEPLPYTIPSTNPFTQTTGYRPEIWALGLRNPWRFSFDRQTGDLYLADVGQAVYEEVNVQPAVSPGGENYGWDVVEGNHCFEPPIGCVAPPGYVPPVAEYTHSPDGNCSVTGGFVYRGAQYPGLQGIYYYGDFCSGRLWGLQFDGADWQTALLLDTPYLISTFGEDQAGNLYLADYGSGTLYRLADAAAVVLHSTYLPLLVKSAL